MHSYHEASPDGVALFYHPASLEHDTGSHPESAERLRAILSALEHHGVHHHDLRRPNAVDIDLLRRVHDPSYVRAVEELAHSGGGYWDWDTYISPGSYKAALYAAGASVAAVDAVVEGGSHSSFALVRPPGHHALRASAMGFCIFCNAAVAAEHATHDLGLERVMIVDWDVHHGNGTQDAFYSRSDVLFFSSHRYPFYPGTGALTETGSRGGTGYTVNVPLPAGVGDEGYRHLFETVVAPVARRYRPQLIIVSAGYDSHIADPLGGMGVTVAGFSEMARIVRILADEIDECGGRLAAILEGGYNVEALAASVVATIAALGAPAGESGTLLREPLPAGAPAPVLPERPWRRETDISPLLASVRKQHELR